MVNERGLDVHHVTVYRWVQEYGPELDKRSSAKRFLRKALNAVHTQEHSVINVDKNAAYPKAIDELKAKEELPEKVELRQKKYLNNIIEQDHRGIKRLVAPWDGIVVI